MSETTLSRRQFLKYSTIAGGATTLAINRWLVAGASPEAVPNAAEANAISPLDIAPLLDNAIESNTDTQAAIMAAVDTMNGIYNDAHGQAGVEWSAGSEGTVLGEGEWLVWTNAVSVSTPNNLSTDETLDELSIGNFGFRRVSVPQGAAVAIQNTQEDGGRAIRLSTGNITNAERVTTAQDIFKTNETTEDINVRINQAVTALDTYINENSEMHPDIQLQFNSGDALPPGTYLIWTAFDPANPPIASDRLGVFSSIPGYDNGEGYGIRKVVILEGQSVQMTSTGRGLKLATEITDQLYLSLVNNASAVGGTIPQSQ